MRRGCLTIALGLVLGVGPTSATLAGPFSPTYGDCWYSKQGHKLTALVRDEEGTLKRVGKRIALNRVQKRCHGGRPTVRNTESIKFVVHAIGHTVGRISLAGGPFAPGRTAEPEASDIEITAVLKPSADLEVDGSSLDDNLRGGTLVTGQGMNLNAGAEPLQPDPDLFLPNVAEHHSLLAALRGGNDTLDLSGGPEFGGPMGLFYVLSWLGPGNDRYVGQSGNGDPDSGIDFILAGPGSNVVDTLGGDDAINVHNGEPDSVDCGPGSDVFEADAFDTLVSCERPGYVSIGD
jgi:hypothetical protein